MFIILIMLLQEKVIHLNSINSLYINRCSAYFQYNYPIFSYMEIPNFKRLPMRGKKVYNYKSLYLPATTKCNNKFKGQI